MLGHSPKSEFTTGIGVKSGVVGIELTSASVGTPVVCGWDGDIVGGPVGSLVEGTCDGLQDATIAVDVDVIMVRFDSYSPRLKNNYCNCTWDETSERKQVTLSRDYQSAVMFAAKEIESVVLTQYSVLVWS